MWTENHISRQDEVWNCIGCVFVVVAFFTIIIIGVGDFSTGRKKRKPTPPLSQTFTGKRGVHQ